MKKTIRPLRLGRETLLHLGTDRLQHAGAAAAAVGKGAVPATISQEGDSCVQSCYFNTCYDTCVWQAQAGLG